MLEDGSSPVALHRRRHGLPARWRTPTQKVRCFRCTGTIRDKLLTCCASSSAGGAALSSSGTGIPSRAIREAGPAAVNQRFSGSALKCRRLRWNCHMGPQPQSCHCLQAAPASPGVPAVSPAARQKTSCGYKTGLGQASSIHVPVHSYSQGGREDAALCPTAQRQQVVLLAAEAPRDEAIPSSMSVSIAPPCRNRCRTAAQHEEAVFLAVYAPQDEALVLHVLLRICEPRRHPAAHLRQVQKSSMRCGQVVSRALVFHILPRLHPPCCRLMAADLRGTWHLCCERFSSARDSPHSSAVRCVCCIAVATHIHNMGFAETDSS